MDTLRTFLKRHWIVLVTLVLAIVLIFEARYFIATVQTYYSNGELRTDYYHPYGNGSVPLPSIIQRNPHAPTIDSIEPWMTFDYINVVFKLPQNYLKNILGINDSQYPNIRLDTYAKRSNINPDLLLSVVKQYITTYKSH